MKRAKCQCGHWYDDHAPLHVEPGGYCLVRTDNGNAYPAQFCQCDNYVRGTDS